MLYSIGKTLYMILLIPLFIVCFSFTMTAFIEAFREAKTGDVIVDCCIGTTGLLVSTAIGLCGAKEIFEW